MSKKNINAIIDGKLDNRNITRLTNEIIDQRLVGRNIKRIDNCLGGKIPINFKCIVCEYTWKARPDNINSGKGCPNCAGNARLTNSIIDNRVLSKDIKRLGNYIGPNTANIEWQCLKPECLYIWSARPANILLEDRGCPKCSNRIRLTNEIIDERLGNRKIIRIGECVNSQIALEWRCLDCSAVWSAPPRKVVSTGTGCPVCFNSAGEKIAYNFLQENNILFEYQKDIRTLNFNETRFCKVDFYLPTYNTIIEYNGAQHYEPALYFAHGDEELAKLNFLSQQKRDCYIETFCLTNKIKLISIDGRKLRHNRLAEYLSKNLEIINEDV